MTDGEMIKRITKLGGESDRNNLIVTIEKWEQLPQYWDEFIKMSSRSDHWPAGYNCGLCVRYQAKQYDWRKTVCANENGQCPLSTIGRFGCGKRTNFCDAIEAIYCEDKSAFMCARRNLLCRMKRALAKLDEVK